MESLHFVKFLEESVWVQLAFLYSENCAELTLRATDRVMKGRIRLFSEDELWYNSDMKKEATYEKRK